MPSGEKTGVIVELINGEADDITPSNSSCKAGNGKCRFASVAITGKGRFVPSATRMLLVKKIIIRQLRAIAAVSVHYPNLIASAAIQLTVPNASLVPSGDQTGHASFSPWLTFT